MKKYPEREIIYYYQFVKDDGQTEIFLLFKRVLKGVSHVIEFSTLKVNVRKKSNANTWLYLKI